MPSTSDPSQTAPSDWRYVNEGGATIVFVYVGPHHHLFSGTVLRLRKIGLSDVGQDLSTSTTDEPDDPSVAFQQHVASKLLNPKFLPRLQIVPVQRVWLESLSSLSMDARPTSRKIKDAIDCRRKKAVLATDLVGTTSDSIAVELKPKWGFLPNPAFLSSQTKHNKLTHCRFCMHSHSRSLQGDPTATGYCPLDLFSLDPERVLKAVASLWDAWLSTGAAINNMRIFVGGSAVSNESSLKGLLRHPNQEASQHDVRNIFVSRIQAAIASTTLFQELQSLQRNLDCLDIEGLSSLWSTYNTDCKDDPFLGIEALEPDLSRWKCFVDQYQAKDHGIITDLPSADFESVYFHVLSFLLSMSFKDCSVILKFKPNSMDPDIYVIDLDPKSVTRLNKWFSLDQNIARSFDGLERTVCIDDRGS